MKPAPLLDTHVWLWWLLGDERLGPEEIAILDALPTGNRPLLCDISLWEVALLVARDRLELDCPLAEFLQSAASPATVHVLPITADTVVAMNALPESFHRDPADRLIVATARAKGLEIATRDARILDSGLVTPWLAS